MEETMKAIKPPHGMLLFLGGRSDLIPLSRVDGETLLFGEYSVPALVLSRRVVLCEDEGWGEVECASEGAPPIIRTQRVQAGSWIAKGSDGFVPHILGSLFGGLLYVTQWLEAEGEATTRIVSYAGDVEATLFQSHGAIYTRMYACGTKEHEEEHESRAHAWDRLLPALGVPMRFRDRVETTSHLSVRRKGFLRS
jgi:hypothetical protein